MINILPQGGLTPQEFTPLQFNFSRAVYMLFGYRYNFKISVIFFDNLYIF